MSSHGGLGEPLVGGRKEEKDSWLKRNGLFVVGYVTLLGLLITFVALYAYEKNKSHNHKREVTRNAHAQTCELLCSRRCAGAAGTDCFEPCVSGCFGRSDSSVTSSLIGEALAVDAIHHIGVTVEDLDKALDFYVHLLGGALVSDGDVYFGEEMQQLLFQREILEAAENNKTWDEMQIPDLSADYRLHSALVNFGNLQIEFNEFRSQTNSSKHFYTELTAPSWIPHVHICWRLNPWASMEAFLDKFERESWDRGFSKVRCNRVINVTDDAMRHDVGAWDNSSTFFVANGSFEGWRLAYCKGPSGEQFEFSQETHTADLNFAGSNVAYLASKQQYSADALSTYDSSGDEYSYTNPICTEECYMTCIGKKPEDCVEPCYHNCANGGYSNTSKSVLGADLRLHAVQHIGITVANITRATRFYIDVFGGVETVNAGGDGWTGDKVLYALMQKELLEARELGVDSKQLGVAQFMDDGSDVMGARYISFGSLYLEPCVYGPKSGREDDTQLPLYAETSSQGTVISMHTAMKLKPDVDLNKFVAELEANSKSLGFDGVRCNVKVAVDSEEQRASLVQEAGDANSITFTEGTLAGAKMAVCKGAESEQFEFIVMPKKRNKAIAEAMKKYVGQKNQWGPVGNNDNPIW